MKEEKLQTFIIADLGFGDGGKGTTADFLTRKFKAHTVIRYNGGSQAAHNVVTPEGKHHTFSQFGSGTFVEGTNTHLSRFMLVDPLAMFKEERHLQSLGIIDAFERTTIDKQALVVTPFHQAVNRLKEITPTGFRHQSCGRGIKEAVFDHQQFGDQVLFVGDILNRKTMKKKLQFLRNFQIEKINGLRSSLPETETVARELQVLDDPEISQYCSELYTHFASQLKIVDEGYLGRILNEPGTTIFEGSQGVLLDVNYGFSPFTTWTDITFNNAQTLLTEQGYQGEKVKLGVLRSFAHRHGAGPFVTEDAYLTTLLPEPHNYTNPWQGEFRVGYFDLVAARYALQVTGEVDGLILTHLDRLQGIPEWKICSAYQHPGFSEKFSQYFHSENDVIQKIRFSCPANFSHQYELSRLLSGCRPSYQMVSKDIPAYVSLLENDLQVPIKILSCGPTALDKKIIGGSFEQRSEINR